MAGSMAWNIQAWRRRHAWSPTHVCKRAGGPVSPSVRPARVLTIPPDLQSLRQLLPCSQHVTHSKSLSVSPTAAVLEFATNL